jgi:hypothetical protein
LKLGLGLPNTMAHETDRKLMLEWARLVDEAGFHVLGTIDKPNYDSWAAHDARGRRRSHRAHRPGDDDPAAAVAE